ncbi:protein TIFY 8 isoform X2 [Punica granatum]|uniref:Protein TIFY n=1 Tax=Punica granatum TaxID=22663 RepID=A0A6P8BU53_PUNGR|nr:protein TIFY 8 isoform X2 [Punica granatum]
MAVLLNNNGAAMAQQQQLKPNSTANAALSPHQQAKPAMFHDFLGIKMASAGAGGVGAPDLPLPPPAALAKSDDVRLLEASPAASASAGASIGGRGGPISTTSDLGSERQVSNHFEGVPFYGPRSDISGTDICNRMIRSKRSSSDSAFMGSPMDGMAQIEPESHENLHLMKILRNGAGGERQRRCSEDETFISAHPMRQASASFVLHPGASSRNDPGGSKWDRSIPLSLGPALQFPPRGVQFASPLAHHLPPNSRHGMASASRQMTIFYGGQAHVFDDVHPNKADIIMALAGSNGGSWSTTFSPKSNSRPTSEGNIVMGENETVGMASLARDLHGKFPAIANSSHGPESADRISNPIGGPLSGIVAKDLRIPSQPKYENRDV